MNRQEGDTSGSSNDSVCIEAEKKKKGKRKEKKNKRKKRKHNTLDSELRNHKKSKNKKRKRSKEKKCPKEKRTKLDDLLLDDDIPGPSVPVDLFVENSKSKAPMTKEEWEKSQSVVRRVYDETGRSRLIKGDGEVLEEIVSKEQHREINRQATLGDGLYFQNKSYNEKK